MSSRVTRSTARQSADTTSPISPRADPPQSAPSPKPPPKSRKRSLAARDTSVENDQDTTDPQAKRKPKRARRADPAPVPSQPSSTKKAKGKGKASMSSTTPNAEPSDENIPSPPATSSSSKRKTGKSKKSPSDAPAAGSSAASRRTRTSTSKKTGSSSTKTTEKTVEGQSEKEEVAHKADEDMGEASPDDSNHNYDEEDDEMDEDPFESSFLGRHGGPAGLSSTLRALSGMMSGMTSRLRGLLENLRTKDDPSVQLIGLQELSEILLVSTEDNLAGHFSPDQYVKELVALMQPHEITGEENPEMMLLACRCIANLMEALPASTASVVYGGAVPVLISKLIEIQYMDLAEQALTTLEKISVEFPGSIVREGGLTACLTYLDFFATSTQRTAVTTAANCCRNIPEDSFHTVKDVMPILLNVLNSNDQRVVEQGCQCVSRIVESFRYQDDKLEELMSADMLRTVLRLLVPGSTNLIGAHIHTQFLRVLSITARASSTLTVELFKMDVVDTLYQVLTGVSPPSGVDDVAQKIDSVVIMQALIHRPRDQVFETLNVICELLPGLGKANLGFVDTLLEHTDVTADAMLARTKKVSLQKRLDLLGSCKAELRRFATILLPTLTDAYSSTVNLSVRQKVLVAQLKMISNLDTDILEDALRPVPYASFLASILSQQDHPILVTAALQAAELLLRRLNVIYRYQFYREGVIAEVQKLADRKIELSKTPAPEKGDTKQSSTVETAPEADPAPAQTEDAVDIDESTGTEPIEEEDDDDEDHDEDHEDMDGMHEEESDASDASPSPETQPPFSESSNIQDVLTRFAKEFLEQYEKDDGVREKANNIMDDLRVLISNITECYEDGRTEEGAKLFSQLARYFEGDALESITSYELLTSQIVRTLLEIFQQAGGDANQDVRAAFLETFMGNTIQRRIKTASSDSPATPFSVLVHKLQDLLSRSEHFEVATVHQHSFDSNRSSAASMLAKQIRVRLEADDESGIPRPYRNIMVSIHAIANFKALDDYLRPRISLLEKPRSGRHRDPSNASAFAALAGLEGASDALAKRLARTSSAIVGTPSTLQSSGQSNSMAQTQSADTGGAPDDTPSARRSTRKTKSRAKQTPPAPPPPPAPPAAHEDDGQSALECADEAQLTDDEALEEEANALDAIVGGLEEELEEEVPDPSAVNMEVATTGKVTARQEDGTTIATPTQSTPTSRPSSSMRPYPAEAARALLASLPGRTMSYAAAVQTTPQDWHLEFRVNENVISNDTTIYRAVHSGQSQSDESSHRNVWSAVHPINFKKVSGPPPPEPSLLSPPPEPTAMTPSGLPKSLEQNPVTADILRLLRILHEMNANLDDIVSHSNATIKNNVEPLSQFVNTKLTAKLNRQLEEPLIVASNCLPSWSEDLTRLYPFLFPFETRHLFLQSTSFGYSRSMSRWQNAQSANEVRRDRHRDERPFLGRLQRQKVRISRSKILESAMKVLELYGASASVLEVEYFEEVGTGLGPTLEFYSNVSKEFSKKRLRLWRDGDSGSSDEYAFGKRGLFPAPMSEAQANTDNGRRILHLFKMLGKFVARSMLDSRIIDVSFNPTFFRICSGGNAIKPSLGAVKAVDPDLANSLQMIKQFALAKKKIDEQPRLTPAQKAQKTARIQVGDASVDDLGLDFTLPGYPTVQLIPNGSNIAVNIDNVGQYVDKVVEYTLGRGVHLQVGAFKLGFSQVFPFSALNAFTPDELVMLFGRNDEDWSIETLMDSIKADHGYNLDSKSVKNLLQAMSELSLAAKRDFLQFVTGSPKLPIGGFKSLTPMFTVVCKPSEPPYSSDDYLPSVMTCVNYLKLPDYSTLDVMREKLNIAIREGQGAFHLS